MPKLQRLYYNTGNLVEMKLTLVLVLLDALMLGEGLLPVLNNIQTHFEYKYSFRGPHLLDSKGNIPFWNHGGSKHGG